MSHQNRLLPRAFRQQDGSVNHQGVTDRIAGLAAGRWQGLDETVDAKMRMFAQSDDRTEKHHPHKQPARQFFGDGDAGIEAVTQNDISEDQHDHSDQQNRDNGLDRPEIGICNLAHRSLRLSTSQRGGFRLERLKSGVTSTQQNQFF